MRTRTTAAADRRTADRRAVLLRGRAAALRSEAAQLWSKLMEEADRLPEADAVEMARVAAASKWGSELPPPFLQQLLELLRWEPAVCRAIRATCSTWGAMHDALCRTLRPRRSAAVMEGKWGWFQSVTEVDFAECGVLDVSSNMAVLRSMPSLRTLHLPWSCAESAEDAEAVYGLTKLTTLRFCWVRRTGSPSEWVLDLSRLTTLTTLDLQKCPPRNEQVRSLSKLTGLTDLNMHMCHMVTVEGFRALSSLTALTSLDISDCYDNLTAECSAQCATSPSSPSSASAAATETSRVRGCLQ